MRASATSKTCAALTPPAMRAASRAKYAPRLKTRRAHASPRKCECVARGAALSAAPAVSHINSAFSEPFSTSQPAKTAFLRLLLPSILEYPLLN